MNVARCSICEEIDGQMMVVGYQDILCDDEGTEIEVVEERLIDPVPRFGPFTSIVEEEPPF